MVEEEGLRARWVLQALEKSAPFERRRQELPGSLPLLVVMEGREGSAALDLLSLQGALAGALVVPATSAPTGTEEEAGQATMEEEEGAVAARISLQGVEEAAAM